MIQTLVTDDTKFVTDYYIKDLPSNISSLRYSILNYDQITANEQSLAFFLILHAELFLQPLPSCPQNFNANFNLTAYLLYCSHYFFTKVETNNKCISSKKTPLRSFGNRYFFSSFRCKQLCCEDSDTDRCRICGSLKTINKNELCHRYLLGFGLLTHFLLVLRFAATLFRTIFCDKFCTHSFCSSTLLASTSRSFAVAKSNVTK